MMALIIGCCCREEPLQLQSSFLRLSVRTFLLIPNMKLSGLSVVFLLLCVDRRSSGSRPKPSCRYPPSQWCRSLEIAIECKVQKQCMELYAIRPNQSVPPVSVTLYYESLCPACRVFISQLLFPTWTMLQDIMTVTLVPYGNAEELPSADSPFTCQHGEPECKGNMIEACIIHLTGHSALQIINCMESAADVLNASRSFSVGGKKYLGLFSGAVSKPDGDVATQDNYCLQLFAPSVSWSTVDSCLKGRLGNQLMHANAAMTRALNPAHTHVPWVTFNGEYTEDNEDRAMSSLFYLVCQLYKGVKPPACTGAPVKFNRGFC